LRQHDLEIEGRTMRPASSRKTGRSHVPRAALAAMLLGLLTLATRAEEAFPARVTFPSRDGNTLLIGYVFTPPARAGARVPAVAMMHGRGGPYSTLAKGRYDATTLTQRHLMWGRNWATQGYVGILVDGFGPRGYWTGFAAGTHDERPAAVDEVAVRPFDAYGALAYLRSRDDIVADRIALQGWSNGGSATLATMADDASGTGEHTAAGGFRAALAFYPGCGLSNRYRDGLKPYAAVRIFSGDDDEEVDPTLCQKLVQRSRAIGGDIELTLYRGATHDFDDPGSKRQGVGANVRAKADATARSLQFLAEQFGSR
jgi:dienelactone hydrolase